MPRGRAQSGSCIAMQYTRTTPYCQSKCRLGNTKQRRVSGDKNGITGHASATRELSVEAENIERGCRDLIHRARSTPRTRLAD